MPGSMETASGVMFQLFEPSDRHIVLEDVALSLSRICRYGGHTRRHYSVAEHASLLSDWVLAQPWGTPRDALTALHHDDSEAFIGDMISPLKQYMAHFRGVEHRIDMAVARRFGTIYPFPAWLKQADLHIVSDERAQVMRRSGNAWATDPVRPLGVRTWQVLGRSPSVARFRWLQRHYRLNEMMHYG